MTPSAVQSGGEAIRLGISACLLGQKVRFDGGHKQDPFLVGTFGRFVEWVPVCPEVELGLGTPRETLRLERRDGQVHFVMPKSRTDHTDAMRAFSARRVQQLERAGLCGYVVKKNSPSCGMERVRIQEPNGVATRTGRGLFAEELIARLAPLPVEEEGRLSDPRLRENFVTRVFAYDRLRRFFAQRWTQGGLVAFHTAHKLLLMAHSPQAYQGLGRLVARGKEVERSELRYAYERALMDALAKLTTPKRHANVLQHMLGYFSDELPPEGRQELLGLIEDHRLGLVPLIVPLTLVRHYVKRLAVAYLQGQVYLEPHPKQLMLLNHV